jgi:hypothetical protein
VALSPATGIVLRTAPPTPQSPAPAADVTAPTVTITSPTNGSAVPLKFTVYAAATDAGGVKSVAFTLDRRVICTDTVAPFTCRMSAKKGKRVVVAKATDKAGLTASASITVTARR